MCKKNYDVIIVGGGAGGLATAISSKRKNKKLSVCILEAQSKIGRKILATGNGRCNLTNMNLSAKNYNGSFDVENTIKKYTPNKLIEFFYSIGLVCSEENNGLVYPLSRQSSSVLDVLRLACEKYGIEFFCDCKVDLIKKNNENFSLKTSLGNFIAQKVVVATGGKAYSSLGANASGLDLLKNLNHKITTTYPALCPVEVKNDYIKSLKGIRAKGRVTLYDENKKIYSEQGEIQFTENSLSGICIFNLTPYLSKIEKPFIKINLLTDYSKKEIYEMLLHRKKLFSNLSLENYFTGFFHKMIGISLLKSANITPLNRECKTLTENEIKKLVDIICGWKFECKKCTDFKKAQVMYGGVAGNQINKLTFESKIVKNLYICGECIDICGDCGGFNLHFAFASGLIAGENL